MYYALVMLVEKCACFM